MADTWLITGIPGAGKTTVVRLLAERLARSVVIEGDLLQNWIVSGNVWPGQDPVDESSRQIHLHMRAREEPAAQTSMASPSANTSPISRGRWSNN